MRALVISGPGEYGLAERPVPVPGPDEAVVAPVAVGLCGTDLELLEGRMVYLRTGQAALPVVPGHEWVGEVVECGEAVTSVAVGDRVVGECSVGCGTCGACAAGAYHQCPNRREVGIMRLDGALAERLVVPARTLHRVPRSVPVEDAVFAEPFSIALRAVLRAELPEGGTVLVTGGGTIGWLIAGIVRELLHADVAVAEPQDKRRSRLLAAGARIPAAGEAFPTVFEASGTERGLTDSLARLAPSGRLVVVGLTGADDVRVDMDGVVVRDQTIVGSLGSPGVWPQTIEMLAAGRVRPSRLVSDRYALADIDEAVRRLREGPVGKVLVFPAAEDHGAQPAPGRP